VRWNSSGLRFLRARGMFRYATFNDIHLHKGASKLTRILCRIMCGVTVQKTSSPSRMTRIQSSDEAPFSLFSLCTVVHPAELYLRHSCDPSRCCDLSSNLVSVTVVTLAFHQRESRCCEPGRSMEAATVVVPTTCKLDKMETLLLPI
jgi:hypothetical protein